MPHASPAADGFATLRERAADKLKISRPTPVKRASQAEALAVLHQLASSPSTAGDAMALLHELQVYQVELELQQEELKRSQEELEAALIRQEVLVERAPVGYMTIDAQTVISEINPAGARLLGGAGDDLVGRPLAASLAATSIDTLHTLIDRTRRDLAPETCQLLLPGAGRPCVVQAAAARDVAPERFLLVLMPR